MVKVVEEPKDEEVTSKTRKVRGLKLGLGSNCLLIELGVTSKTRKVRGLKQDVDSAGATRLELVTSKTRKVRGLKRQ